MKILALALALLTLTSGCALTKGVFTNPTGLITINRQEFINTYAVVRVLYKQMRANAEVQCDNNPVCLDGLTKLDAQVKLLNAQIEAKIEVPESQIDWAVIKDMLGMLISLVP